ncbi:3-oxoacyl-ACP reductase FabG [Legionella sp.]|uniref:3-oxoacyl-ACP reductase FabG n=1 Tax=Legionella sp. TaxID=459 RepID=UPI003C8A1CE9
MSNLEDKVALVTGASRGIGQAIALKLAQKAAFVYGTATTEKGAEQINEYFKKENLTGKGIVLNVTNAEQIERVINTLVEESQAPAILVNNAGITADNLLLRMDDDEWFKVIETNLNSIYRMSKICIKSMFRARWGRIISIGSVVGSSGNTGQVNYTAAKAGVIGFTKSLAQEIGSRGITVNVVAPGFIDTDMTTSLPEMVKEEMLKRIPLRKLGQPEDVANAVAFLASEDAKYITGSTIHVNGGMYMD